MIGWEQIADEGLSRGRAGGFAYPDAEPGDKNLRIVLRKARGCRQQAPECRTDGDQPVSIPLVAERSQRQPDKRVNNRKDGSQEPQRGVAQLKFVADRLAQRSQQLPVEKVQEVDGEQQKQCVLRTRGRLGEGAAGGRIDRNAAFKRLRTNRHLFYSPN